MPSAPLTINYASVFDIQNTADLLSVAASENIQRDDISVTPLTLAKYFLYDASSPQTNFGQNISNFLNYPGGFITVGDKVNVKYSDFEIQNNFNTTSIAFLNRGFDMTNSTTNNINRIKDVKRLPSVASLFSGGNDDKVLTVGDFKEYSFHRGMIMMWSGSYNSLRKNLPFWRLCAAPDVGLDASGVTVPNLQGLFIMAGSYSGYQSTDNFSPTRNFGTPTQIGSTGAGANTVTLTKQQLESHQHNNAIAFAGGNSRIYGVDIDENGNEAGGETAAQFMVGGVDITALPPIAHSGGSDTLAWNTLTVATGWGSNSPWTTVRTLVQTPVVETTLSTSIVPIVITRPSLSIENNFEIRGGDAPHENRPPYYALAYIIYVGRNR
jgi:microcystin-dependent protein